MMILLAVCVGGCLCVGLMSAVLFPVFAQAREAARLNVCAHSMREVGQAITSFAADKGRFPATMEEAAANFKGEPGTAKCSKLEGNKFGFGFAYNAAFFANKKSGQVGLFSHAPLLIEIDDPKGNDVLTPESRFPKRHMNGRYVNAFFIGQSVRRIKLSDAEINMVIPQEDGKLVTEKPSHP